MSSSQWKVVNDAFHTWIKSFVQSQVANDDFSLLRKGFPIQIRSNPLDAFHFYFVQDHVGSIVNYFQFYAMLDLFE